MHSARAALRPALAPLLAFGAAIALTAQFPDATFRLFAGGAASLLKLLLALPVQAGPEGWWIGADNWPRPVLITRACAAADYFTLLAPLLAWRLGQRFAPSRPHPALLAGAALALAVPLTLAINALRIVAVIQAHRWVIPLFPPAYGDFLHLLAGVAVFLPALLLLDLALQSHAHAPSPARA